MRAVSLHRDVIVVTSQIFQAHCTLVRDPAGEETIAIDSLVLPEELELLPALVEQAGLLPPRGLLATHADWDHLLAPLAFPAATLGCAESSVERLRAELGTAQRMLRRFDEELQIERPRPLSLAALQPLAVPGSCQIGQSELELHPATGHTADGMAVWIPWARVLVAGDYLSPIELPGLGDGEELAAYEATLERLHPLVLQAEHVLPGHGPPLHGAAAASLLLEDRAYLQQLRRRGGEAELPPGRRSRAQRELHAQNVSRL
jgi:glyoxylase-like metal-dependent hydrolase (beta-lactamase superfamily II)